MTTKKKAELDTEDARGLLDKLAASGTGDEKIARAETWLAEQQALADRKEDYTEPTPQNLLLAMRVPDVTLGPAALPRWPEGTVKKAERILAGLDPVATPFGRPEGEARTRAQRARESVRPEGAVGPPIDPRHQDMREQGEDVASESAQEIQARQLAEQKEAHEEELAAHQKEARKAAPREKKAKERAEAEEEGKKD